MHTGINHMQFTIKNMIIAVGENMRVNIFLPWRVSSAYITVIPPGKTTPIKPFVSTASAIEI